MNHRLRFAGLALVLGTAAACGGGSGAPTDASEEDFCAAYQSVAEDIGDLGLESGEEPDMGKVVDAMKGWGEELEEVGTPEDIPEDARKGFEVAVDTLGDLDADELKSIEDFDKLEEDLSESDQEAADAFDEWANETCGAPLG